MNEPVEVARKTARSNGARDLTPEAALVEGPARGLFLLSGKDPMGMLNAILTNTIPADAGRGAYALLLSPKGRVQTDLRALKAGDRVLIVTEPEGRDAAHGILGRYAPFSRVEVEDLTDTWSTCGLYGPRSGEVLDGLELAEHQTAEVGIGDETFLVAGVTSPLSGYDVFGPREAVARAGRELLGRGAVPASPGTHETARIAAGIPRFGADLTPENFPGEAGVLNRAVDFAKGCYPGQETVARMHYRGHPNRTLYRVSLTTAPTAGTAIFQHDKPVGTLTSVAPLQVDGAFPALAYLSRRTVLDAPMTAEGQEVRVLGEAG